MNTVAVGPCRMSRVPKLDAIAFLIALSTFAMPVAASYRIESLYSNLAGWFQYIELRETSPDPDGRVTPLAGSVITVRHGAIAKRFVIPADPPGVHPIGASLIISTIADWSSDDWGPVPPLPPDYVMPERFLPTGGGTIDLDGQDSWTFGPLPVDGSTALLRSGITAPANGRSFALGNFSVHVEYDNAIEYYNAGLDHYFITASAPDLDAIEAGRITGWQPTGHSLGALTVAIPTHCCSTYGQVAVPVCRFHIPPASHFYSAFAEECDQVAARYPTFVMETRAAFFVYLPDRATGTCPVPFRPVFRLWNQRADTNHRYIGFNDLPLRGLMLEQGWLPEGYGPEGVAWCN